METMVRIHYITCETLMRKPFCQEFHIHSSYTFTMFNPETSFLWNNIREDAPGKYKKQVINFKELL